MNNFAAQFNAFRTQQERDEAYLFELRRTNAVKREAIATLEEKIARCKEHEAEQKRKREIAENQQKEQMEKLSVNVIKAKNLLTDVESFFAHSASLATTDAEIRERLADFKMKLEKIKEANKNLREVIRETMQPVTVAPDEVAEIRGIVNTAMEKLNARAKAFDLTAIVAEVQTIEQQRKERMKMSETLVEKRELLSALDIDNGSFSQTLEEKEESSNRLEALSSQNIAREQKLASVTAELRETQQQIADLKQKNAEVHAEIASTSAELTRMKTKIFENDEALQAFRKKHDQWKAEIGLEEQKLQVERLKVIESYLHQHEENERKAAELRSILHESRSELEELKKQVEHKQQKLSETRARHENLRKDVEAKKQAMEKEMEDAMAEMQRQEAEIQRIESESEQVRNKNNEIENAIQLLKHQLSTKADELAVAKENFRQMLEAQEAEKQKELSMAKKKATPVKLKSFSQLLKERTRGKDSLKQQSSHRKDTEQTLKKAMSSDKQHGIGAAAHALESNSEDSPDVMPKKRRHKKRQAGALKANKVKKPENVTETEHTAKGPMRKERSFSDFSPASEDEADDFDAGNAGAVEGDVVSD
ncbi:unnamed protein product [Heligmosomoides polygyrus]|uniref:Myosin_tail_1 domain-containing protein n=1 Tax=Heligmosomoides polygyrus TaxID=6339 RepID=A0A3P8ABH5_HELPZ|nr:unnamed protein product [Heligmosomoides polygyrus]